MGYLRLIHRRGTIYDKELEQARLLALLLTIPGVSEVNLHGEHPKGGIRAACTFDRDAFDDVIATLERAGWMAVI